MSSGTDVLSSGFLSDISSSDDDIPPGVWERVRESRVSAGRTVAPPDPNAHKDRITFEIPMALVPGLDSTLIKPDLINGDRLIINILLDGGKGGRQRAYSPCLRADHVRCCKWRYVDLERDRHALCCYHLAWLLVGFARDVGGIISQPATSAPRVRSVIRQSFPQMQLYGPGGGGGGVMDRGGKGVGGGMSLGPRLNAAKALTTHPVLVKTIRMTRHFPALSKVLRATFRMASELVVRA